LFQTASLWVFEFSIVLNAGLNRNTNYAFTCRQKY